MNNPTIKNSPEIVTELRLFGIILFSKTKRITFPIFEIEDGTVHLYHPLTIHGGIHASGHITSEQHIVARGTVTASIEPIHEDYLDVINTTP